MATTETSSALERVPNLSGGKWTAVASQRTSEVFNPSTGHAIAEVALSSAQETNDVVQVAADALADWSETPIVERARVMFRCLLYTSPSPRDLSTSRMPSSA